MDGNTDIVYNTLGAHATACYGKRHDVSSHSRQPQHTISEGGTRKSKGSFYENGKGVKNKAKICENNASFFLKEAWKHVIVYPINTTKPLKKACRQPI